MAFQPLERLLNLYDGYRKAFSFNGQSFLLLQAEGQVHFISADCPHKGYSLANATIKENTITCAGHGITFNLETGLASTEGCPRLQKFQLAYLENEIGFHY